MKKRVISFVVLMVMLCSMIGIVNADSVTEYGSNSYCTTCGKVTLWHCTEVSQDHLDYKLCPLTKDFHTMTTTVLTQYCRCSNNCGNSAVYTHMWYKCGGCGYTQVAY